MSTLKVDTYLTRGGASEIAIDKLKGVTAVATINVVGEGGTNTTSLQQGLAKAWVHGDTNGAAADSFNVGEKFLKVGVMLASVQRLINSSIDLISMFYILYFEIYFKLYYISRHKIALWQ